MRGGSAVGTRAGPSGGLAVRAAHTSLTPYRNPASFRPSRQLPQSQWLTGGGLRRTVAIEALGLVETRGFTSAVEAADAMCKAARVRLMRYEITREARVTVMVRGPLAEVEAAVAAGARSAGRVGELLVQHVIPAPEPQLERIPIGPPSYADSTEEL